MSELLLISPLLYMQNMSATSTEDSRGTPPVFISCRALPDNEGKPLTVHEICAAAEKTSGYNSVIGAQRIGSLWRVYPRTQGNRASLLLNGFELRNRLISPNDKNPFIVRTPEGEKEAPTTKLIIGNLPISYSNQDIETKLRQLGCELQSKMMMERDRDENGGLTRWLTGRRFAYMKIPDRPLPEKINIGPATATLYHREQKATAEYSTCSRCLTPGHRATTCTSEVVCIACKQPGHKKGHPSCPLPPQEKADVTASTHKAQATEEATVDDITDDSEEAEKVEETEPAEKVPDKDSAAATEKAAKTTDRGRPSTAQSCIPFKVRPRSNTREKRKCMSPPQHQEKSKKTKDGKSDGQHSKTSPVSSKPPGKKS